MEHDLGDRGPTGELDRRRFLSRVGGALAAVGCVSLSGAAPLLALGDDDAGKDKDRGKKAAKKNAVDPSGPYGPFLMSIQSYSLRKFNFEKMVASVHELELKAVELYPGHFPQDQGEFEFRSRMRTMRHNQVKTVAYGVVPFTKDHEANRKLFDLAKKLNLSSISADPAPDSFDSLEKLVEEFRIPIAIHNHGPEDQRYRTAEMIEKAIAGKHKLIGLCIDAGHFLRVDVNPVEVAKKFKERVFGVHLKDVKSEGGKKRYSLLGEGDLDLLGFLKTLKENGFAGGLSLEYEEEEDAPMASIAKCLASVREAVKKI